MTIIISSFSNEAASKKSGLLLKQEIEKTIHESEFLTIDFNGITRFASPFFNSSFASLALKYGFDQINKINLINLSSVGLETYETSMSNAKMLSSNPVFADEVTKIIQETPKYTGE
jgi:hypothetical protein